MRQPRTHRPVRPRAGQGAGEGCKHDREASPDHGEQRARARAHDGPAESEQRAAQPVRSTAEFAAASRRVSSLTMTTVSTACSAPLPPSRITPCDEGRCGTHTAYTRCSLFPCDSRLQSKGPSTQEIASPLKLVILNSSADRRLIPIGRDVALTVVCTRYIERRCGQSACRDLKYVG